MSSIFTDAGYLVQLITDVSGLSNAEVARRLLVENRELGTSVWKELQERKIRPYQWSDDLNQFYESTTAFLFESLIWNRSTIKQQMQNWINQFLEREFHRPLRVLVFGDGLGFDSASVAQAGHQVSYFEVSQRAIQFATQAFNRFDSRVEILSDVSQIQPAHYDAILCLDVLEHVPQPEAVVKLLVSALAPEGRLIVHAPFWYLSKSVGTHLASNRKLSGDIRHLYGSNGLHAIEASLFWNPIAFAKTSGTRHAKFLEKQRIRLGGLLLSVGRFWSTPHELITKRMLAQSLSSWPEMERFAKGLTK